MVKTNTINPIEAYCKQHNLEYLYQDGSYYLKTEKEAYLEVKINEDGNFVVPTDKGDMLITKKHYNADCLDAYLRHISAENNVEAVRFYSDAKNRNIDVVFNAAKLNPNDRLSVKIKNGHALENVENFANDDKFQYYAQKNGFKASGILKIGEDVCEYRQTDNGYVLYTKDGEIAITDNGNSFHVTQNTVTTTHEKEYDYSFKVGDKEIVATKEALDLELVKKINESEINSYNENYDKDVFHPELVRLNRDDYDVLFDDKHIYMNEKYFNTDGKSNEDVNITHLTQEGKIKYAHAEQRWKNQYKSKIFNPKGITQEEALRLNMYDDLTAIIAEVKEIYDQYPYPKKQPSGAGYVWLPNCRQSVQQVIQTRQENKKKAQKTYEGDIENHKLQCRIALKDIPLSDATKYEIYRVLTTKHNQNDERLKQELARITYEGYIGMYCAGISKEKDLERYAPAIENIQGNIKRISNEADKQPIMSINDRFSPSSNGQEFNNRVDKIFSSVNGINLSDLIKHKNTNFEVAPLYAEPLKSYANLDVEYTMISENTLKAKMRDDRSSYAQATENLEHIAENQNNNEKSANVNTDNIMALMATKNGNSL